MEARVSKAPRSNVWLWCLPVAFVIGVIANGHHAGKLFMKRAKETT
jgi:hypothetical protein